MRSGSEGTRATPAPSSSSNSIPGENVEPDDVEPEDVLEIMYEPGSNDSRGTIRWADGDLYEGGIKDGEPHGRGVCRYENGGVYDGDWKGGIQHGEGTLKYANGSVYEGQFTSGREPGKGTLKWKGAFCEGSWKEGAMHGWGKMTDAGGNSYEGQWAEGKEHGKGTRTDASGEVYEGEWVDGLPKPEEEVESETTPPSASAEKQPKGKERVVYNHERKLRSQRSQQKRLQADKKACECCGVDDYQYKLRVCSGCNLALYCSGACQKAASRSHRRICNIISELPPRDADRLALAYDRDKLVDFDAGLRYGTKYMDSLKHLTINIKEIAGGDALTLSGKHLSSLFRSKTGTLNSVTLVSSDRFCFTSNGAWNELRGLKRLYLEGMRFNDAKSVCFVIYEQRDTLEVLRLPYLQIDWSKAKTRRLVAQTVGSCKQLVKLQLTGCVLMDSDLKIMLRDVPHLRILNLTRNINNSHELTDNTCGLIARKCPRLQELHLFGHYQLSVRGIRKIFEGCAHLRSLGISTRKLSCNDVQSLFDVAPQLILLALDDGNGLSEAEASQIIEATGGRTVLQLSKSGTVFDSGSMSAETRAKYEHQQRVLFGIWDKRDDPEVPNAWAGMSEE